MRFVNIFFSKEDRYSLGMDLQTLGRYFAIPVSNQTVDYEEYYAISNELFETFMKDHEKAKEFARQCGRREHDELLIIKPGADRGVY